MLTFRDQTAIITGASSGIGKAIALGLAAQGARLCLVGRKLETLEAIADLAGTGKRQIVCYQADLALEEDLRGLVAGLQRDFEHFDILIHSAGVISLGRFEHASVDDLDWQYRVNVRAPYILTQALLPGLTLRQGQIVFINSSLALSAKPNAGPYAVTKHALRSFADTLREEVNAAGVRILSVFLGRTATPMQAFVHEKENREYHPESLLQPEDVSAILIAALSLPRTAEVTDICIRPMQKS